MTYQSLIHKLITSIGCHAAEISDSGEVCFSRAFKGVHTEIHLNPGRRERFAELPRKAFWSEKVRYSLCAFTVDEPSPHQAEL